MHYPPLNRAFYNIKYGDSMLVLDKIIDALSDLVVALPKKNRENRKEIREVVLSVQTEMERAIELAILYIDGTKRIIPDQELIVHLQGASSNLMSSYNEFKICAGLYGLADRFDEVFSSIKGAINAEQINAVEDLIRSLANGESLVIDGLRGGY
jgi:DNA-binding cell septation regulator SpoVG